MSPDGSRLGDAARRNGRGLSKPRRPRRPSSPTPWLDARCILKVEKGAGASRQDRIGGARVDRRDDRGVTRVEDVSFTLREGEIVGIAGVAGNGQSELLEALSGIRALGGADSRQWRGPRRGARHPKGMRALGVGSRARGSPSHRSRDAVRGLRERDARFPGRAGLRRGVLFDRGRSSPTRRADGVLRHPAARAAAQDCKFLRRQSAEDRARAEIDRNPAVILVGQPTRGVDIGAIEFIHKRIVALRDAGKAVLLVSVELDEIFALSDRSSCSARGASPASGVRRRPTPRTSAS